MRFALAACAALVLAAFALDSEGRGGGRGGGAHGHAAAPGHVHAGVVHGSHFHPHGGTRVVVGASFVAWPAAYYWPGYYYPPGYYAPAIAVPAPQYWYYCAPLGAYYPYVPNCPVAWELVIPTPPQPY
jgi:hypothetical protein